MRGEMPVLSGAGISAFATQKISVAAVAATVAVRVIARIKKNLQQAQRWSIFVQESMEQSNRRCYVRRVRNDLVVSLFRLQTFISSPYKRGRGGRVPLSMAAKKLRSVQVAIDLVEMQGPCYSQREEPPLP